MEKIVVLGGGESGCGAAVLAQRNGYSVFVSDIGMIKEKYKNVLAQNGIEWEELQHSEDKIFQATEIVKSPGIPETIPIILDLKKVGIPIVSEIEFACRYTNSKIIAITGSNGKTTTTLLIGHILKKAGLNVCVAGNIGDSFAFKVLNDQYDYYVLEISSFQLDGIVNFKPDIAIILNITPDHLNRYNDDMQLYIQSKLRITKNQDKNDYLIYCSDDKNINKYLKQENTNLLPFSILKEHSEGACLIQDELNINVNKTPFKMNIQQLALQGKHNIYNSMAAAISSRILDLSKEVIRDSLIDFKNVEHRLERVIKVHGIEFINDSKATNVNSTWYALESMIKPTIWIVGGVDKGNDYSTLLSLVKDKVKAIVCLGDQVGSIKNSFSEQGIEIHFASNMKEAVNYSYQLGEKGDAVLLSPACASFDLFENYEDRGFEFKKCVRNL
jgi:UDP-N-acetylmuramoylalanine--D-glutamate ligase